MTTSESKSLDFESTLALLTRQRCLFPDLLARPRVNNKQHTVQSEVATRPSEAAYQPHHNLATILRSLIALRRLTSSAKRSRLALR